jgi:3-deoxy-D-arabino-heptulosonate 7-phosphate (DAHP) synthase
MSFIYKKKLVSHDELISAYPMSAKDILIKKERDKQIKDVLTGASDKFLVIIGPCSADNEDAVCDYVSRLAKVQEKVSDRIIIIPRIFTNKPRTTGEGYKGIAHQPDPEREPDLQEGLMAMRKMHLRAIAETGLTAADEMLYLENWPYVEDLLSYVVVGARSVENQPYRLTISGMDCPAGMKNPTSGDFSVMLNSCVAAQGSHTFLYRGYEVRTSGNPLTHCILRGAINKDGIKVIEFNARFGDPEVEVVLPRLKNDIFDVFCSIIDGKEIQLEWSKGYTLGIVLASKGYPGSYEKGYPIKGLEKVEGYVYHMGTKFNGQDYVTNGGRVLIIVQHGDTLLEAQRKALKDAEQISCENLFETQFFSLFI